MRIRQYKFGYGDIRRVHWLGYGYLPVYLYPSQVRFLARPPRYCDIHLVVITSQSEFQRDGVLLSVGPHSPLHLLHVFVRPRGHLYPSADPPGVVIGSFQVHPEPRVLVIEVVPVETHFVGAVLEGIFTCGEKVGAPVVVVVAPGCRIGVPHPDPRLLRYVRECAVAVTHVEK